MRMYIDDIRTPEFVYDFIARTSEEAFEQLLNMGCNSKGVSFDYHESMGGIWFMVQDMTIFSTDLQPTVFKWFENPVYMSLSELRDLK